MHTSSTRGHGVQAANHLLLAVVTAVLAACGGGGGGTDSASTGTPMTSTSTTTPAAGNAALPTGSTVTAQSAQQSVFRVNADAAGQQVLAEVAALQGGGYAIAWVSHTNAATSSVRLQRFDDAAQRVGAELAIEVPNGESDATVAVLPDGGVAVATLRTGAASADQPWITRTAVVLRRYDAAGAQLGAELQVASIDQDRTAAGPMQYVAAPRLVHWDDGTFLLAWSQVQDDANGKVPQFWVRRFDATGQAVGLNLPVGSGVAGSDLQLVAAAKGGFVIATAVSTQGGTYLMYRGFDGAFSPVLPADALGAAEGSRLLPLQGGAQVLLSPVKNVVAMQLYDARGQAVGAGLALRAMPVGMTALRDGGFVLVTAGDAGTLLAQHYDAAGNPVGTEQPISGSTTAAQGVSLANGSMALGWTATNGGDQDVMGTRITP
jgi:hypothetical protein